VGEDFALVEADFQQYYHLDVVELASRKFTKYARLLENLPPESRFISKYNPLHDWDFGREMQSQTIQILDVISCQLYNMNRGKGKKALQPREQFQPDYVKKAKKELFGKIAEDKREENRELIDQSKAYWEKKNYKAKKL